MTAILYPIAATGEAALAAPIGRASRAREAAALAGQMVVFVTESVGPAFATREAALDAYAGKLDDDRPGRPAPAPEDRVCSLTEIAVADDGRTRALGQISPVFREGRRWPAPAPTPKTAWRLQVSFWRLAGAEAADEGPQARQARRRGQAAELDGEALKALTRQPLKPVRPQQPLDIGLFEARLPESPHIIVPDE
jgi:hypothetical protein